MSLSTKLDKQIADAKARPTATGEPPLNLICEDVDVDSFRAHIAEFNAKCAEVGAPQAPAPPKDCPAGTVLGAYRGFPVIVGVLP